MRWRWVTEWNNQKQAEIVAEFDLDNDLTGFSEKEIETLIPDEAGVKDAINASSEYMVDYDAAEKQIERVNRQLTELKKQNPGAFKKAKMIVLDGRKGGDVLILIDNNLNDVIKELKRYAEQGEPSPLAKLMNQAHKL